MACKIPRGFHQALFFNFLLLQCTSGDNILKINHIKRNSVAKQVHPGPGVHSASNRNEYQEYFLRGEGVKVVGVWG